MPIVSRISSDSNMLRSASTLTQELFGHRSLILSQLKCLRMASNATAAADSVRQQGLPRLPVPELDATMERYLKSVRPHLSDEEFAVTTALTQQFAAQGGPGHKLQNLLKKRAEGTENWLADWWLRTAYLDFRWTVVVHSNPGLVFPFRKFQSRTDQLSYAAQTVLAALDYKLLIDSDGIPLEKMGKAPLDMSQYKKVFGTCRIPGVTNDSLSFNNSRHITVFHKGHIFTLPVWGEDGVILNVEQLVQQFESIVKESQQPCEHPVGILTSENRNIWGRAYKALSKDKNNAKYLNEIESSLFVLCLDEKVDMWKCNGKAEQQTLAGAQTIHGGGSGSNSNNRWFDKTIQFLVSEDGCTGLTYEHSPAEGQPIAVLTDYLMDYLDGNKSKGKLPSSTVVKPWRLDFNVSPEISNVIITAQENMDVVVEDLDLNCFTYDKYGKDFIKSQKLSPDSYLQMAMQFAFYRLHEVPGAHYESAATRMYAGGRTETIRSCSSESVAFARAMLDASASHAHKLQAMQAAIKKHKELTVEALQGYGVDRHLLGLKLTAIENGLDIPKLYLDTGFVRSAHMRISTSQVAAKCDGFMCYGPLVPNGYATCYNPRPRDVNFGTSAFRSNQETDLKKYRQALEQSLQDMHDLLLHSTKSKL